MTGQVERARRQDEETLKEALGCLKRDDYPGYWQIVHANPDLAQRLYKLREQVPGAGVTRLERGVLERMEAQDGKDE